MLSRTNQQRFDLIQGGFMKADRGETTGIHFHPTPLAAPFSWLLHGAGRPPIERLAHFWSCSE